jgi:2-polyprenyl-3-methyl-5-hydroxy-6-metoxy-1,4-benzoquinol methylase
MKFPNFYVFRSVVRGGREALRRKMQTPLAGRFQVHSHTLPDRYPWLFEFAKSRIGDDPRTRLLSFGCSRGDEVFSLRKYFPAAEIKGVDVDPRNIKQCLKRSRSEPAQRVTFAVASTTENEQAMTFDAIFCLAVLCHGDLTATGAVRCDPHVRFEDFERIVTDFERCLKPGGLLFLHTANFRFSDTAVAPRFDVMLEAKPEQLAPDVLFGRDNRLLKGVRYHEVAFRKRATCDFQRLM